MRLRAFALLAVLVALPAENAFAQLQEMPKPPPDTPAQKAANEQRAKELYAKGDSAYAEGRYEEALAAFQEAYSLSNRPQLLYNISNALERLGRYGQAADALDNYLASGKTKERDVLQRRIANLRKRADDQKKEQDRIAAKEEEERQKQADAAKKREAAAPPPDPTPTAPPPPPEGNTPVGGIVVLGLGGAALVVGGVFGVMTLSARSSAKNGCTDTPVGHLCESEVSSDLDREKTLGLVADAAFVSGIVLAAIGTYLIVTHPKTKPTWSALLHDGGPLHLASGPGQGGLSVAGSF